MKNGNAEDRYLIKKSSYKICWSIWKILALMFYSLVVVACTATDSELLKSSETASLLDDIPDADDKISAMYQLADMLEQFYVFPDKGKQYADYLRNEENANKLVKLDTSLFATTVTKDLQNIYIDAHLRVELAKQQTNQSDPSGHDSARSMPPPQSLIKAMQLTPEIGYARFDSLWGDPNTIKELQAFIDRNINSTAVIIDFRANRGGGLAELDLITSHLFNKKTDLLVMEVRRSIFEMEGGPFQEGPNLQRIDSPDQIVRLMHSALPADTPKWLGINLFILTSPMTASAAEHFALALQRTGKATIVGEVTKGAAHFGGLMPIGSDLRAFIPAGRTYNPDTGNSWEEVGIQPNKKVATTEALTSVLEIIGVSSERASELSKEVDWH